LQSCVLNWLGKEKIYQFSRSVSLHELCLRVALWRFIKKSLITLIFWILRMLIRHWAVGLFACLSASMGQALAQTVPPSSDPSRLPERVTEQPRLPRAAPLVISPQEGTKAPEGAEKLKFKLRSLTVKGSSVYSSGDLVQEWSGMLGREVSVDEIFKLADKLSARYRTDGYVLSQVIVPHQEIDGGRVTLQAVEGYLSDVKFEGDPLPSLLQDAQATRLKASRPLRADVMERALLLFRGVQGFTTTSVLQAAPGSDTGASI
jgi:hemolysin activation/secretion protein